MFKIVSVAVFVLLGLCNADDSTVDSRATTDSRDSDVKMTPVNGVCKICYPFERSIQCKTGPIECFGNPRCSSILREKLCPNIRLCPNATKAERFPVVVKGQTKDGVYAVCQCRSCKRDNTTEDEVIDREKPIRKTICCGLKRSDRVSSIEFVRAPESDCKEKGGTVVSDERCKPNIMTDPCSRVLDPICDVDGNYYPNRCFAKEAGVNRTDLVPCKDSCGCIEGYRAPICVKLGNGEFKTFRNRCRYRCGKESGLLNNSMIVSDSICKADRVCRIREEYRRPVCDTVNNVTYASLKECKCSLACATPDTYKLGRCPVERDCVCSDLVSDTKPICLRGTETIRDRCKALCAGVIDIPRAKVVQAITDAANITEGVCKRDMDDCSVLDDVRNECDESDRKPIRPALRAKFRLKLCYPDFFNKVMLFDSLREAIGRLLYSQCNITREDADDILITAFKPLNFSVKVVANRWRICIPDQAFDVAIAAYFKNYIRIKKAFDCFSGFPDLIKRLRLRFKEAYKKRDPSANCQCLADPTALMCTTECSDCECDSTTSPDDVIGYGDAEIVEDTVDYATLDVDGMVLDQGDIIDPNQGNNNSTIDPELSNAFIPSYIFVFIAVFVAALL